MAIELMNAEWEQLAEKLRKNGYALIQGISTT
jgi:hypothetical protein